MDRKEYKRRCALIEKKLSEPRPEITNPILYSWQRYDDYMEATFNKNERTVFIEIESTTPSGSIKKATYEMDEDGAVGLATSILKAYQQTSNEN